MKNGGCSGTGTLYIYVDNGEEGVYKGDILGSIPYGKGQFYSKKGNLLYDGDWADGRRDGIGTVYFADSTSYKGEVHDGECTGNGTYYLNDQTKFKGYFKDAILMDQKDESSISIHKTDEEGDKIVDNSIISGGGWRRYPMLNYGYSSETRDNNKWFAAVASGDEILVERLVEKEGFIKKINMKMPRVLGGMTALHVALRFGREEVTVYLVWRCRVELEPLDSFNRTPMDVAREEKGKTEEIIERQRASIMVVRTAMEEFDKERYLQLLEKEAEEEKLRKEALLKEKFSKMAYLV
jgi:hypothetical protein